jgi:hypothetical protein
MNSTYSIMGIPEILGIAFVAVAFVSTIAPYTPRKNFGTFQVPDLGKRVNRLLKIIGPVLLCVAVGLFFPLWNPSSLKKRAGQNQTPDKAEKPEVGVSVAPAGKNQTVFNAPVENAIVIPDSALIISTVREKLRHRPSMADKNEAPDVAVCNYLNEIASDADRLAEIWLDLVHQAETTNSLTKAQRTAIIEKHHLSPRPNALYFSRLVAFSDLLPRTVDTQLDTNFMKPFVNSLNSLLAARGEAVTNLRKYLPSDNRASRDRSLQAFSKSV